jgi:hypothetical protein
MLSRVSGLAPRAASGVYVARESSVKAVGRRRALL